MIKKIQWNDSYLLDIKDIDLQHKKLLLIASQLYEVVVGEQENYVVEMSKILKQLTEYTVYHFEFEEKFMRKYDYQNSDLHKMQHDNFIATISREIKKLDKESKDGALRLYTFTANWVLNHIAKSDIAWAKHVHSVSK